MNRIDRIFKDLRSRRAKALMPFLTAGDPDLPTTAKLLGAVERAGASICEVGIPFSDPIADGPVIAASMTNALTANVGPLQVLDMVAQQRKRLGIGLVAMVSYSIIHRLGTDSFISQAKTAGIDGFIIPDLPLDESQLVRQAIAEQGLICSMLIAPTTPIDRAMHIAGASTGFIYLMARAGITGEQKQLAQDLPQRIKELRLATDLPIAVGFGISDAQQVSQVVQHADAVIVGSAIMRCVAQVRQQESQTLVAHIEQFVGDLARGLAGAAGCQ